MDMIKRNERERNHYYNDIFPTMLKAFAVTLPTFLLLLFSLYNNEGSIGLTIGTAVLGAVSFFILIYFIVSAPDIINWDSRHARVSKLIGVHNRLVILCESGGLDDSEIEDVSQKLIQQKEVIESERKKIKKEDTQKSLESNKKEHERLIKACNKELPKNSPVEKHLKELESEGY